MEVLSLVFSFLSPFDASIIFSYYTVTSPSFSQHTQLFSSENEPNSDRFRFYYPPSIRDSSLSAFTECGMLKHVLCRQFSVSPSLRLFAFLFLFVVVLVAALRNLLVSRSFLMSPVGVVGWGCCVLSASVDVVSVVGGVAIVSCAAGEGTFAPSPEGMPIVAAPSPPPSLAGSPLLSSSFFLFASSCSTTPTLAGPLPSSSTALSSLCGVVAGFGVAA